MQAQTSILRIDTIDDFSIAFNPPSHQLKKTLFLTGELHGVSSNPIVEFSSLKYFVLFKQVKYILLEAGFSDSYLLNSYLISGDTAYLDLYVSDYPNKYHETRDATQLTKILYDSLKSSNKFSFVAVDIVENDGQPYAYHLFNLITNKKVYNGRLKTSLLELNHADSFPNHIEKFETIVSQYKPHIDYDSSINEIISSYKYWINNKQNLFKKRDYYLYQNVLQKTKNLNSGNIYGHFGYGHIDVKHKCMTYFLNEDSSFYRNVFSIYPYYKNCSSSFFKLPKVDGFNQMALSLLVNKRKLKEGIYLINYKHKYYHLHIDQKEMTELEDKK
jgi:hypothetical protein